MRDPTGHEVNLDSYFNDEEPSEQSLAWRRYLDSPEEFPEDLAFTQERENEEGIQDSILCRITNCQPNNRCINCQLREQIAIERDELENEKWNARLEEY